PRTGGVVLDRYGARSRVRSLLAFELVGQLVAVLEVVTGSQSRRCEVGPRAGCARFGRGVDPRAPSETVCLCPSLLGWCPGPRSYETEAPRLDMACTSAHITETCVGYHVHTLYHQLTAAQSPRRPSRPRWRCVLPPMSETAGSRRE